MTADRSRQGASSTSRPKPSARSRRSGAASSGSASPGEPSASDPDPDPVAPGLLGAGAIRDLARRHGVRPTKALGQNFLIDPNLARAIAADAGVGRGDRVVEVGAGLGSLTVALAATGAEVLAVEFDRNVVGALREVVDPLDGVTVVDADVMGLDWAATLDGSGWVLCANLPYNIATPLILDVLARVPQIERASVMVQREAGERLAASAGDDAYGAVSVRVAARARASIVRKVPPSVFWPRPAVSSVVVRIDRLTSPAIDPDDVDLWRIVDAGFAERRKTMRNALRRLGIEASDADDVLRRHGLSPSIRAEELDLETFAAIASDVRRLEGIA
jgi:16S rRNA (adenine1518-N6/adenine1519-N6)-dimethyltransferase